VENGNYPIIDGLPSEFSKTMLCLLADDICCMANEAFSLGILMTSRMIKMIMKNVIEDTIRVWKPITDDFSNFQI
jgi:hypothetical protein